MNKYMDEAKKQFEQWLDSPQMQELGRDIRKNVKIVKDDVRVSLKRLGGGAADLKGGMRERLDQARPRLADMAGDLKKRTEEIKSKIRGFFS